MARGSRHARKLARTFQLRDWSVGLSGARQCVAQNGVTRAAGSGLRRGQCHGLLTVGWSYSYKELDMRAKPSVALYSTCPPYRGGSGETYLQHVRDVARWSEAGGCEGILVYTDNSLFDPGSSHRSSWRPRAPSPRSSPCNPCICTRTQWPR